MQPKLENDLDEDDIVDPEYEKFQTENRHRQDVTSQIKVSNLQDNPINKMTECFSQLSKIAGKQEGNENLEPFFTPQIRLNLHVYKKKKRRELMKRFADHPNFVAEIAY